MNWRLVILLAFILALSAASYLRGYTDGHREGVRKITQAWLDSLTELLERTKH